jgi:hypothetical protein
MAEYLKRGTLNYAYIGDLYAAMCSFGLCLPNVPHKSELDAVHEVTMIKEVKRMVITGCRVAFDRERDADLYDPTCKQRLEADVNPYSGVISTRLTAAGAHFHSCDKKITSSNQDRMDAAVRVVNRTYCQPQDADPGGPVLTPFALDGQDRIYIIDQDNIDVPVLCYGDTTCIDYTPDTIIGGIMVIDNAQGVARKCITRDLYQLPNPHNIYCDNRAPFIASHTRRIIGFDEPLGTEKGTEYSLLHMQMWLTVPSDVLAAANGLPRDWSPAIGQAAMETPVTDDYTADSFNCGDKSMLGGPLPIKLMEGKHLKGECNPGTGEPVRENKEHQLAATARVAPLIHLHGVKYSASFDHDGAVDVDALASRMSRMENRNVIGVAMQRIKQNTQGDLMLHDGV